MQGGASPNLRRDELALKVARKIRVGIDVEYNTDIIENPIHVGSVLAAGMEDR